MHDQKDYHFTGYRHSFIEQSRELRRRMTPQERRLWYCFLKNYPLKVYRQRSIDRFIVDFYCSKAKLVIELDGSQHYTVDGQRYDTARSQQLELYGLEVIRFSNADIDKQFHAVCAEIDRKIQERASLICSAQEKRV